MTNSNSARRPSKSNRARGKNSRARGKKSNPPWLPIAIIGGVLGIIVVVTILSSGGSSTGSSANNGEFEPSQVQPVTVSGSVLSPLAGEVDTSVGSIAPEISGFGFDGRPVAYNNGAPRAVLLLTHWCSHCQAEVAELTAYLTDHNLPSGVEIQTISTWVDPGRGNYPPSKWLDGVSWPFTVLADDHSFTAANAFGLSGTPMWVFIDANGTVVERTSRIGAETLVDKLLALAA